MHDSERQQKIDQLFEECLGLATQDQIVFLSSADVSAEIRDEVASLLREDASLGNNGSEPFKPVAALNVSKMLPDHPDNLVGEQLGPYTITDFIGSGGCGNVYTAERSEQFQQKVAIKIIRFDRSESRVALRRFDVERQVLADLRNENIAGLLDGGCTVDGRPYFVMEFIDGLPITDYCDQHRLTIRERLSLFVQVCRAVSHAHRMGVVHRDIKPGNILVTNEGMPKLVDFGIAKILDLQSSRDLTNLTETNQMPMTPAYASPEQFRGESVSVASDVYSLGIVLYELVVGRHPFSFKGLAPHEIANLVSQKEPSWPSAAIRKDSDAQEKDKTLTEFVGNKRATVSEFRRQMRGDLDHIVLKAMRNEPDLRYDTTDRFADDIQNALNGHPVTARSGSLAYVTGKFLRLHAVLVSAAALVLVALVGGFLSTLSALRVADNFSNELAKQSNELASHVYELEMKVATEDHQVGNLQVAAQRLLRVGPKTRFGNQSGFEWYHLWNRVSQTVHWPMLKDAGAKILHAHDDRLIFAAELNSRKYIRSWSLGSALLQAPPDEELGENRIQYRVMWGVTPVACSLKSGLLAYFQNEQNTKPITSTLILADLKTGEILDSFNTSEISLVDVKAPAMPVAISPDGKTIVSNHQTGTLCFWQITPEKKIKPIEQLPAFGHQIRFSPDGTQVAIANRHGSLHLWDLASRQRIWEVEQKSACCLCWSNDGSRIICGSESDGVKVWDKNGRQLNHIPDVAFVGAVAVTSDNRHLAIGETNGVVHIWKFDDQPQPIVKYRGHVAGIDDCAFIDSDSILVTTDGRDCVRLWPVPGHESKLDDGSPKPANDFFVGHDGRIWDVAFHPNGEFFATTGGGAKVKFWSTTDHQMIREFDLEATGVTVSFSPDGQFIATGEYPSGVPPVSRSRLWELKSGKQIKIWENRFWMFFHKKLDLIAHQGYPEQGIQHIVRFPTMAPVISTELSEEFPRPHGFRFTNQSESYAQIDQQGRLQICEVQHNQLVKTKIHQDAHDGNIPACEFAPNDSIIATGGKDAIVKLWDTKKGECIQQMTEHGATVKDVAFHPLGTRLASASFDGTVRIWEVPSGQHRLTLQASRVGVNCVAFSPDGNTLVAGGKDGSIYIWHAATPEDFEMTLPVIQKRYLRQDQHAQKKR